MRIKLRFSNGVPPAILTLGDEASTNISTLLAEIRSKGNISPEKSLEVRYGFPPTMLDLSGLEGCTVDVLGVKLDGEQLVVNVVDSESAKGEGSAGTMGGSKVTIPTTTKSSSPSSWTPSGSKASTTVSQTAEASTSRQPNAAPSQAPKRIRPTEGKDPKDADPPTVPLGQRGTVTLRVMEDDNSCLFNATSYVASSSQFSSHELRHVVASTIQSDPVEYNAGYLGEERDKYCEWITMETSWGGGIELKILANFFDLEIISMDVGTGNVYRFNEGKQRRKCIVIYSGIHYDALALSPPSDYYPGVMSSEPERDITIFDEDDDEIVQAGSELLRQLKERHYHTDTQNFTLRCNICRVGLKGGKQAIEHAKKTGHQGFGEYA